MHSFCINSNQMWCDQVQSIHILSRSDSKPEVFDLHWYRRRARHFCSHERDIIINYAQDSKVETISRLNE